MQLRSRKMQESTPLNQSPLANPTSVTENRSPLINQILIGIAVALRAGVSINIFMILPYIVIYRDGDFFNTFINEHVYIIPNAWSMVKWNIWQFYALTALLTIWGSISILFLGGRKYYGPPTLSGYRPEYTHSGFRFYLISMAVTVPLIAVYDVSVFYKEFVSFIAVLIVYAFIFSVFCYIKAIVAPSNEAECIKSGNCMVDFWRGVELYPRIGPKLDLKTLIACRHCLFLLQIIYLVMIKANSEIGKADWKTADGVNWSMLTVTVLQTFYLAKWFYWEDGYKNTIDFIVERGGYYLMGACIALIPSLYSLYNLFLAPNTPSKNFGPALFAIVTILGIADISCIYWADRQRQLCRDTDGKCVIWGKEAEVIRVNYLDANGKERKSLLLSSGFWGLSRHPNYFLEIMMFLIWSLPAVFTDKPLLGLWYSLGTPLFVFLIMFDRSRKDDAKCKAKYGDKWDEYCQRVPYKIIPYVY